MFRNWNRAVLAAATGLCLAGGPAAAKSSAVALVCDGEFRLQTARIDGIDETMFGGTIHVALVAEENAVVEVRLQSYEDGMKMPIQTFRLPRVEEEPDLAMSRFCSRNFSRTRTLRTRARCRYRCPAPGF